ncbi:MAG: UTP--glucose-1-phosphate uridylyltransferase [Verrucomicrobiota bacterium]
MIQNPTHTRAAVELITRRMERIKAPPRAIETFLRQYHQLVQGHTGLLTRDQIEPVAEVPDSAGLENHREAGARALAKTLMIKLNGGLGTSMGLDKVKSLLPVKDGRTFLDIVIGQVAYIRRNAGCPLPLVLMNSFYTHEDTLKALLKYPQLEAGQRGIPSVFIQHQVPKIRQDNFMPVEWPQDRSREWCPPGHGDLYLALCTSGTLTRLLDRGYEYAFVSNTDNLGATLNLPILGFFAEQKLPFLMEVTDRTEADKKGGHIARSRDGRLLLREIAQCPAEEEQEFQDIAKYKYFNTNNLWLNLRALKEKMENCGHVLDLPLIVNRKSVDARDAGAPAVYQLETAMGSALSIFAGAQAVRVPRVRFAPVKTTEDLLALWSDAYVLTEEMNMVPHADRNNNPTVIHLDPAFFGAYGDFKARFAGGAPSLRDCNSLTVEGDFRFGRGVTIRGKVHLRNTSPKQELVEDGAKIRG